MLRKSDARAPVALLAAVAACGCGFVRAAAADDADARPALGAPAAPAPDREAVLLVVAPRALAESMEPLIAHKKRTGMPARLVVIETLERGSGRDDAERVKRAIVAAHERHGTRYVLLVGDASRCPVRFRRVAQVAADADVDCTYNPTDLYYANLYKDHAPGRDAADPAAIVHSGRADDWDADGDGVFDAQHWADDAVTYNPDRVDGCPDVAVGRLPAHTPEEAAAYVAKVISYESTPSLFRNCARFSFVADANCAGATDLCESIIRDGVRVGFQGATTTRLLANPPAGDAPRDPWQPGTFDDIDFAVRCTGWVIYVGHGDARSWGVGDAGHVYDAARVAAIDECEKPAVLFAVACDTGRFMCWAPSERYADEAGREHEFVHSEAPKSGEPAARGAWQDKADGRACGARLIVPRPGNHDLAQNHDRTFACAWLFAPTGAIVYAGECLVCENDKGAELVRDVLARGARGGTVVGDMWLEGQRRYWLDNRASEGVFRSPRIYLGIMTLFGDPSLRLQAAAGDPPPPTADAERVLGDLRAWDAATSAERRAAAESVAARETDLRLARFETFSCGGQTHEVSIWSHERTGLEFVLVPAGTFAMGSPAAEPGQGECETQHAVTLTRPMFVARTECTQASWDRVGGPDGRKWRDAERPVEGVSWDECDSWCRKAGLELPTEAQWEWACRAGTTTRWSFGDDESQLDGAAWFRPNAGRQTHPVAQKASNAFGLHDMHGNVREWCADWYDDYPPGTVTDPKGPPACRTTGEDGLPIVPSRVCRGGWFNGSSEFPAGLTRSAARSAHPPDRRRAHIGFRPVRVVRP